MSAPPKDLDDSTSVIGMILGFGVFFLAYAYTVVRIFLSIAASKKEYQANIDEDLATMQNLGLNPQDFAADLAIRLSGEKQDDTGDDQLMGEATKV